MNEIGWPAPCGYTIFCDDVRLEVGNKPSFMGVYGGQMLCQGQFPLTLAKFALVVHYFERPEDLGKSLELTIFMPGDPDDAPSIRLPFQDIPKPEEVNLNRAELGDDPRLAITSPVIFAPFTIAQAGRLKVRMVRGGDEVVRLGALMILAQPEAPNSPSPLTDNLSPAN